jgi:Tfp pilus assembly protein PilZ
MEPLKSKDKRAGIRIPLLSERVTYFVNGVEKTADITDITADGLFLKTSEILPPRTNVLLQLHLPGDLGSLQVNAQVIRVNWVQNRKKGRETLGMGVRFEDVQANIKKIIDAYVVYLRNKQIITVSKRIIEEFFGSDNPKKIV